MKKVFYYDGNNNRFDYFILNKKSQIEIDKESLAYKFDKKSTSASIINLGHTQGNFNLLLERRLKNGIKQGLVPCNFEDIKFL